MRDGDGGREGGCEDEGVRKKAARLEAALYLNVRPENTLFLKVVYTVVVCFVAAGVDALDLEITALSGKGFF